MNWGETLMRMDHRHRVKPRRSAASGWLVIGLLAAMTTFPATVRADDITVEGKRSEENKFEFIWTVTNHSDKRITSLTVDHYLGKIVKPPKGWVRKKMTANVAEKQRAAPGIIEFGVEEPLKAIGRGQSRDFTLTIERTWHGHCERRAALVGFEDGTTLEIPGVICPADENWFKKNVSLVGLGAMFALFVLWRVTFGKKSKPAPEAA